jgi:hypothetical protein
MKGGAFPWIKIILEEASMERHERKTCIIEGL